MIRLRITIVASLALAIAVGLSLAGFFFEERIFDRSRMHRDTSAQMEALEQRAKGRYEAFGDLAPCDIHRRPWPEAAQRHLTAAGEPPYPVLVVVAPTFSEIMLLGVGPFEVTRYRMPGLTAFGPEFVEAKFIEPERLPPISLTSEELLRLSSGLRRSAQYAVGNLQLGADGVTYFIVVGTEWCAKVWSPQAGVGHAIARAVDSLLKTQPDAKEFQEALSRLESIERSH